jgi:hypothetical protein
MIARQVMQRRFIATPKAGRLGHVQRGIDGHRQRHDRVVRRPAVGLVDPPAAAAVPGDRVRGVLGQLAVGGQRQTPLNDRGMERRRGRNHPRSLCGNAAPTSP